ncbi:MAG: prepilin peptidase, partial [Deltaproteobacteria bacterium]
MILPQVDYQTTKIAPPEPLHQNLDRAVNQLLGRFKRLPARIKYWQQQATEIIAQSLQLQQLGAEELTDHLLRIKAVCRRKGGEVPEETVIEAFTLIAEASERSLGIRPYTVQILAALALQHGYLAEMATGEGKTLTATFPAILTAWSAQPCHIVTANDYLAQRDAEELSPLYSFCAVTTGWIEGKMDSSERRHNYSQGVVYTTGKELLADFLRDRLSTQGHWNAARWQLQRQLGTVQPSSNRPVLRGINTAIIDEADSVLIDEAVTPLIISQPQPNQALNEACLQAREVADNLDSGSDYQINQHYREITLTPAGRTKLTELSADLSGWFGTEGRREELLLTALNAKEFYQQGSQYLLDDDKVVIIDEYTGRMMP